MIQLPFPVIKSAIPSQLQPDTLPIADRDRWRNRVTSMLRVPLIQSEERGLGHNTIPIHHGSKAITRHNRNRKWNSLSRTYRGGGHGECHRGKLTPTFSGSASWWWHKKKYGDSVDKRLPLKLTTGGLVTIICLSVLWDLGVAINAGNKRRKRFRPLCQIWAVVNRTSLLLSRILFQGTWLLLWTDFAFRLIY